MDAPLLPSITPSGTTMAKNAACAATLLLLATLPLHAQNAGAPRATRRSGFNRGR